jgi:hypothetical protein
MRGLVQVYLVLDDMWLMYKIIKKLIPEVMAYYEKSR